MHNYALAFIRYCHGDTLEVISDTLQIELNTLQHHAYGERWAQLRQESLLPIKVGESVMETETRARVDLIKRNREENFQIACQLKEDLTEAIGRLRRGEKLKRYFFASKMATVVEHDVEWTLADRVALANYAQMIANIGYQALGDANASGKASDGPANAGQAPHITVILPGLISQPREARAKVVNVESVSQDSTVMAGFQEVGNHKQVTHDSKYKVAAPLMDVGGAPEGESGLVGGAPDGSEPCVIDLRPFGPPAGPAPAVMPPSCKPPGGGDPA